MLAIDVSKSMTATDVSPTRLDAAQAAAKDFVESAPAGYRIGLVTFDAETHTLASPTTDRAELLAAIDSLEAANGTAAGDGLATAVDVLDADADRQPGDRRQPTGRSSCWPTATAPPAAPSPRPRRTPRTSRSRCSPSPTAPPTPPSWSTARPWTPAPTPTTIAAVADRHRRHGLHGLDQRRAVRRVRPDRHHHRGGHRAGRAHRPPCPAGAALLSLALVATMAWTPRLT